jgi:hypothetical protein
MTDGKVGGCSMLARSSLGWGAACWALSLVHCLDFDFGSSCPDGCGTNQVCVVDVGCVVPAGACSSDSDCGGGEVCAPEFSVRICKRDTGSIGDPCGDAPGVPACVPQASCMYRDIVMLTEPSETGPSETEPPDDTVSSGTYFEAPDTTRSPAEPICVGDGSLGEGQFCSDSIHCLPGLVCNGGYEPPQCRPASDIGGPCRSGADCRSERCVSPQPEELEGISFQFCATADPGCDIRLRPACGYWLSCDRCAATSN